MSGNNFQNESLVEAWTKIIGEEGDLYRLNLINPIVLQLLNILINLQHKERCDRPRCIGDACRHKCKEQDYKNSRWSGFYNALSNFINSDINAMAAKQSTYESTILDLGCGEGYLGRLLAKHFNVDYLGIDISPQFIEIASSNPTLCNIKKSTICYKDDDLEHINFKSYYPEEPPGLILMVTVLDHIANPVRLLSNINGSYGLNRSGYLLAVTCNHAFYNTRPSESFEVAYIDSIVSDSGIEKAGVEICFRSISDYLKIFRDAGVTVIDRSSISLFNLNNASFTIPSDNIFDKTAPPFHFWLLKLGQSHYTTESSEVYEKISSFIHRAETFNRPSVGLTIAKKLLDLQLPGIRILQVSQHGFVTGSNNLGGNLFICINGEAFLENLDNTFEQAQVIESISFLEGHIIGELELPKQNESDPLYQSSVIVKSLSAEFIEIPAKLLAKIFTVESCEWNIFTNFTSKFREKLWIFNRKHITSGSGMTLLRVFSIQNVNNVSHILNESGKDHITIKYGDDMMKLTETDIQLIHDICCLFSQALEVQLGRVSSITDTEIFNKMIAINSIESRLSNTIREIKSKPRLNFIIALLTAARTIDSFAFPSKKLAQDIKESWKLSITNGLENVKVPDTIFNGSYRFVRATDDMLIRNIALNPGSITYQQLWSQLNLFGNKLRDINGNPTNIVFVPGATTDYDSFKNSLLFRQYLKLTSEYIRFSINSYGYILDSFGDRI